MPSPWLVVLRGITVQKDLVTFAPPTLIWEAYSECGLKISLLRPPSWSEVLLGNLKVTRQSHFLACWKRFLTKIRTTGDCCLISLGIIYISTKPKSPLTLFCAGQLRLHSLQITVVDSEENKVYGCLVPKRLGDLWHESESCTMCARHHSKAHGKREGRFLLGRTHVPLRPPKISRTRKFLDCRLGGSRSFLRNLSPNRKRIVIRCWVKLW